MGSGRADALAERLADEMKTAWRQQQHPLAEDFLKSHAELSVHPQAVVRLIYEEICLRHEYGLEAPASQFVKRFPHLQRELKFLLECHDLLRPATAVPVFPEVGQTWCDYQLVAELGRGSFGRVFLARQSSLSDRPVVLKMMPAEDGEHLSLARLQHTHIVPLYAVQEDPSRHIRALCMPYFGGASFDRILQALTDKPVNQRTGQDLLSALDRLQAASPIEIPRTGPARQLLARASYVQAVCWLGMCLAEALQYAHDRGLVHLDLKPHNVLLASDGQTMLLDFNLARQPLPPGTLAVDFFGGTPEYMSPEQAQALTQIRAGLPIVLGVDNRSDIYSLGLVLYEALGGVSGLRAHCTESQGEGTSLRGAAKPFASLSLPYLRQYNPQVSTGAADLIHKCLAPRAADRYANAAAVAADLRRYLADLPLRGVRNRSLCERWGKWRRRQPQTLVHAGVLLTLVAAASVAGVVAWQNFHGQLRQAEQALADGQMELHDHAFAQAARTFRRGMARAQGLPTSNSLLHRLAGQLHLAQRAEAAQQLHRVADGLRFLYGMESLPAGRAAQLEAECRQIWDKRDLLRSTEGAAPELNLENDLRDDLRDLAILWADLHVRLAASKRADETRQDALRLLTEAEQLFGRSYVLARQRQEYAESLGRSDLAQAAACRVAELTPRTAWEHYTLGRFLLRSADPMMAIEELERALELRPQDFWPNFYRGVCTYRLGHYEDALCAFRICVALAPDRAECFYHRGLAEGALGHPARALHDYNRALEIDPTLAAAALNRGILHYQREGYNQALEDLRRALDNGADAALVHYNMALVYLAQNNQNAALSSLRHALEHDSRQKETRQLYDRLLHKR